MKDDLELRVQSLPRFIQASSDLENDPDHTTVDVPVEECTMLEHGLKDAKIKYELPKKSGYRSIKDGKAKESFVDSKSILCEAPLGTVVDIIGKMLVGKEATRRDSEAHHGEAEIRYPASVQWKLPPVRSDLAE